MESGFFATFNQDCLHNVEFMHHHKKLRIYFGIGLVLCCLPRQVLAGERDTCANVNLRTIILPHVYKPWKVETSLSVLFTRLPMDWIETSLDVPVIQFNGKLGLPAGFTLESSIQSVYVSNQVRLGPHWNLECGRFSFSPGVEAAVLFGRMTIAGFNNKAWGWSLYPSVSLGFSTGGIAFTLVGEYNILESLKITSGDAEITHSRNFKSGHSIALYMEQRLWKNHIMVLGVINNFQKFYYLAWPAFSTFNRRYYIPQVYIGLVL